jgi:hypothetical protein
MRKSRYEMLLPLKYNDGQSIPFEKHSETREELLARFGAISSQPGVIHGTWIKDETRFEDDLLRIVVDVEDTPENHQFFVDYKTVLKERFQQVEVYMVCFPVDLV